MGTNFSGEYLLDSVATSCLEGAVLGEVFEERHQSIFIDAQLVLSVCLVPKIGLVAWVIRHNSANMCSFGQLPFSVP
jgi:hypothetical protein